MKYLEQIRVVECHGQRVVLIRLEGYAEAWATREVALKVLHKREAELADIKRGIERLTRLLNDIKDLA